MAWPDGSRFLIAHGVKWGSGPKMYKGSKHDTTWNNDLLWKLYVEQEARKTGIHLPKGPSDIDAMPPFMRPLACAISKKVHSVPLNDPFRNDGAKTCQSSRNSGWPHGGVAPQIRQSMPGMGLTARQRHMEAERLRAHVEMAAAMRSMNGGGAPIGSGRPGTGRSMRRSASAAQVHSSRRAGARAQSALGGRRDNGNIIAHNLPPVRSSRSRGGGEQGSARKGDTAERLRALEDMLAKMQRDRSRLASSLQSEVQRRRAIEQELAATRDRMSQTVQRQSQSEAKLRAYQEVMTPLVKAISARQRKSAR